MTHQLSLPGDLYTAGDFVTTVIDILEGSRYLLNKGLSLEIVARIMGHSSTKITRHYDKLLDKTVFKAVDEIMKSESRGAENTPQEG